jgi:hypothetical protein
MRKTTEFIGVMECNLRKAQAAHSDLVRECTAIEVEKQALRRRFRLLRDVMKEYGVVVDPAWTAAMGASDL